MFLNVVTVYVGSHETSNGARDVLLVTRGRHGYRSDNSEHVGGAG